MRLRCFNGAVCCGALIYFFGAGFDGEKGQEQKYKKKEATSATHMESKLEESQHKSQFDSFVIPAYITEVKCTKRVAANTAFGFPPPASQNLVAARMTNTDSECPWQSAFENKAELTTPDMDQVIQKLELLVSRLGLVDHLDQTLSRTALKRLYVLDLIDRIVMRLYALHNGIRQWFLFHSEHHDTHFPRAFLLQLCQVLNIQCFTCNRDDKSDMDVDVDDQTEHVKSNATNYQIPDPDPDLAGTSVDPKKNNDRDKNINTPLEAHTNVQLCELLGQMQVVAEVPHVRMHLHQREADEFLAKLFKEFQPLPPPSMYASARYVVYANSPLVFTSSEDSDDGVAQPVFRDGMSFVTDLVAVAAELRLLPLSEMCNLFRSSSANKNTQDRDVDVDTAHEWNRCNCCALPSGTRALKRCPSNDPRNIVYLLDAIAFKIGRMDGDLVRLACEQTLQHREFLLADLKAMASGKADNNPTRLASSLDQCSKSELCGLLGASATGFLADSHAGVTQFDVQENPLLRNTTVAAQPKVNVNQEACA